MAAGKIHSDMEKGFIAAEVIKPQVHSRYYYECLPFFTFLDLGKDFMDLGGTIKVRAAGLAKIEGRGYAVTDGDIMLIKFNKTSGR